MSVLLSISPTSPWTRQARYGPTRRNSHWWGILRGPNKYPPRLPPIWTATSRAETNTSGANRVQDSHPDPNAVIGNAVILDFDYLSEVYAVHEIGANEAWLSGPKEPPAGEFEILIHSTDGFVEYLASVHAQTGNRRWVVRLEALATPRFLQKPTRILGKDSDKREVG